MMPNSMGVEVMLVRLQCQPRTWPSVEGMSQLEWCTPLDGAVNDGNARCMGCG